ncbi:hypothetical protein FB451DRAFT_1189526 [Mycena latifolia]|nr:hypothetical protein FB451DRAFT_1189526 [Mycena latifolia]
MLRKNLQSDDGRRGLRRSHESVSNHRYAQIPDLDSHRGKIIPFPLPSPLCGTPMGPFAVNIDAYVEIWRAAEQAQFPMNPADTYDWNKFLCGMVDVGGKVRFARSAAATYMTTYMDVLSPRELYGSYRLVWLVADSLTALGCHWTFNLWSDSRQIYRRNHKSIEDMALDGDVGRAAYGMLKSLIVHLGDEIIRGYGTFYGVLKYIRIWMLKCGITIASTDTRWPERKKKKRTRVVPKIRDPEAGRTVDGRDRSGISYL